MKYLALVGLPCLTALVLTPLLAAVNRRCGLLDLPDDRRKLHRSPVPTAGGLAILIAFYVGLIFNHLHFGQAWDIDAETSLGLSLGLLLVGTLGFLDDWRNIGPWGKISVQLAGGLLLYFFGFKVHAVTWPFGDALALGWLELPATLLWVLLITNAINLIDGVDGLAASIVIISLATLAAVSLRAGETRILFYAGIMGGSLAGFYIYNFPPAKIFLGDCGSLSLGFTLAALSLLENRKGTTVLSLMIPLVAMGVPLIDAGLAFLRRSRNGISPLTADRGHLHHRLLRLGLTPRQVVYFFIYTSLYLGFSATLLAVLPKAYVLLMVLILALGVFVALEGLRFLESRLAAKEDETIPTDKEES